MNGYMMAGMVTGIVLGLIVAAVMLRFTKKNKKEKFTYDERQKAARGEAYKYAFYVLVIYNVLYGVLEMAMEKSWAEPLTAVMIGVCLAVLVHIIYSIWNECYFSMNEEPVRVLILFAVISAVNIIIAINQGIHGRLIENGMLTNDCANLIVAVMFGCIMIALAVKWKQKESEAEGEE